MPFDRTSFNRPRAFGRKVEAGALSPAQKNQRLRELLNPSWLPDQRMVGLASEAIALALELNREWGDSVLQGKLEYLHNAGHVDSDRYSGDSRDELEREVIARLRALVQKSE